VEAIDRAVDPGSDHGISSLLVMSSIDIDVPVKFGFRVTTELAKSTILSDFVVMCSFTLSQP
jgi:hypothetical protein